MVTIVAGDVYGEECEIRKITYGTTVTKGQLLHLEDDGYWDPAADADAGEFAVAMYDGVEADIKPAVLYGRVGVTFGSTVAVKKGKVMMAGATGTVVKTDNGAVGENVGKLMTDAAGSGTAVLFLGDVA